MIFVIISPIFCPCFYLYCIHYALVLTQPLAFTLVDKRTDWPAIISGYKMFDSACWYSRQYTVRTQLNFTVIALPLYCIYNISIRSDWVNSCILYVKLGYLCLYTFTSVYTWLLLLFTLFRSLRTNELTILMQPCIV